jgi:hypothetical protein
LYDETKKAVKKAFEIGRVLFSLGTEKYTILLKALSLIRPPIKSELDDYINDGMSLEEAIITEMKKRYKQAAVNSGFQERHGLAMLEYAALLDEMSDE